jgi:hypothetical protein
LLKPEGTPFVVEPKGADRLEDNLHPIAAMYYGFSLVPLHDAIAGSKRPRGARDVHGPGAHGGATA